MAGGKEKSMAKKKTIGQTNLVGVRSSDEEDRPGPRDLPSASWVDFSEEQVDQDTHDPQEKIIFPCHHGV